MAVHQAHGIAGDAADLQHLQHDLRALVLLKYLGGVKRVGDLPSLLQLLCQRVQVRLHDGGIYRPLILPQGVLVIAIRDVRVRLRMVISSSMDGTYSRRLRGMRLSSRRWVALATHASKSVLVCLSAILLLLI